MPISSRALPPGREGSETMAQASTLQAERKPPAPAAMWGEDIVRSPSERRAALKALQDGYVETASGCWEWSGGKSHGYGQLRVHSVWGSTPVYAHRLSYLLHCGPIPDGTAVCHTCDNPPCCNPKHLFLGDQAANVADMVAKGRQCSGERNGMSKISDRDVETIRELRAKGYRQYEIAKMFGISEGHLSTIIRGKKRATAAGTIARRHGNSKLTEETVHQAHDLFAEGVSFSKIGKRLGVSDATIRDLILGNTWKSVYEARSRK